MTESRTPGRPASIPLVDLKAQYHEIKEEIDEAIGRVVGSGRFILGEEVAAFEQEFARYLGVRGTVGLASGTAAVQLALLACGIGPGDEVITPAHAFVATAEAIWQTGARPVLVDIDPDTYNVDPGEVEGAVTDRTRAIVPIDLYGYPAEMPALREIADRHGLRLIEDAAQAHGARYGDAMCGSFGDIACFSFYPSKNLGAYGDAGAVVGNDEELLARVAKLRDHGRTAKYEHEVMGFGERLDTLQAVILRVKLRHLDDWVERRREVAETYSKVLSGTRLVLPREAPGLRHAYHLYVARTEERDRLLEHLRAGGISAGIHYPIPVHRQPAYLRLGYPPVSLPCAEQAAREVISLPLYPEMSPGDIETVCARIMEFGR